MSKIVSDVPKSADQMVQFLKGAGYKADYSVRSLREIDRFIDDNSRGGQATPGGKLAPPSPFGKRMFGLGAYVGEVIRRSIGGTWHGDDADPRAEINIELDLPDGRKCWPVQQVLKRFRNGRSDSIAAYGQEIQSSSRFVSGPRRKKKPWWKFW